MPGRRLHLEPTADGGKPGELLLHATGATLLFPDHGLASISFAAARSDVVFTDPDTMPAAMLTGAALQAMVAEAGWNAIHASLLESAGRGVMFCGERSRGKSSSCLALVRSGWTMRADDRCFLRVHHGTPEVWGPGGEMRLRQDALSLWPDLAPILAQAPIGRGGKWLVSPASVGGLSSAGKITRPVLFFPDVVGSGEHRIEPMPAAEALEELLFASGLATLPKHAAQQFRDLTVLLDQAPCYRLHLGREMDALPQAIAEVLR